jgi:hypothetical protein
MEETIQEKALKEIEELKRKFLCKSQARLFCCMQVGDDNYVFSFENLEKILEKYLKKVETVIKENNLNDEIYQKFKKEAAELIYQAALIRDEQEWALLLKEKYAIEAAEAKKVDIYDPAMCCSTGICGPVLDPVLVKMNDALMELKKQGVVVKRFNLAQQPKAFMANKTVAELLQKKGKDTLPITFVNEKVFLTAEYPSYEKLCEALGLELSNKINR